MLFKELVILCVVFLVLQSRECASKAITDEDMSDLEKDLAGILSSDTPSDESLSEDERSKITRLLNLLTREDTHDKDAIPKDIPEIFSKDAGHPPGYKPKKPGFPEAPSRDMDGFFSSDGHPPGYKPVKPGHPEAPIRDTTDNAASEALFDELVKADAAYKRDLGFAKDGAVFNVPNKIPAPAQPEADVPVACPICDQDTPASLNEKKAIYAWIKHLSKRGEKVPDDIVKLLRRSLKLPRRQ